MIAKDLNTMHIVRGDFHDEIDDLVDERILGDFDDDLMV
jgi:hypothetical protein